MGFGTGAGRAAAIAVAVLLGVQATAEMSAPELVSANAGGTPGDGNSYEGAVTPNGRFVVFDSVAQNLGPTGSPGDYQVYLLDRQTGDLELLSADASGNPGNGSSYDPCISANGRFVLFESQADNLLPGDLNSDWDVFLLDRKTGELRIVSASEEGVQGNEESRIYGNSLSPNGHTAVFTSYATNLVPGVDNGARQVYLVDLRKGTLRLLSMAADGSEGDQASAWPSLSANGKFVAFQSAATNLLPAGQDTNGETDAFLFDLKRGTLVRVSVADDESQGTGGGSFEPVVSNNGKTVVFNADATNLVPGDTNGHRDVFLRDVGKGTTTRISVRADGTQGDDDSYEASVTSSGKIVAWYTNATNLNPDLATPQGGIFLYDAKHGTNRQIDLGPGGEAPDGRTYVWPWSLTPTGNYLLMASRATLYTDGDTGGFWQVYVMRMR